jgi:hypothetical protein
MSIFPSRAPRIYFWWLEEIDTPLGTWASSTLSNNWGQLPPAESQTSVDSGLPSEPWLPHFVTRDVG